MLPWTRQSSAMSNRLLESCETWKLRPSRTSDDRTVLSIFFAIVSWESSQIVLCSFSLHACLSDVWLGSLWWSVQVLFLSFWAVYAWVTCSSSVPVCICVWYKFQCLGDIKQLFAITVQSTDDLCSYHTCVCRRTVGAQCPCNPFLKISNF